MGLSISWSWRCSWTDRSYLAFLNRRLWFNLWSGLREFKSSTPAFLCMPILWSGRYIDMCPSQINGQDILRVSRLQRFQIDLLTFVLFNPTSILHSETSSFSTPWRFSFPWMLSPEVNDLFTRTLWHDQQSWVTSALWALRVSTPMHLFLPNLFHQNA